MDHCKIDIFPNYATRINKMYFPLELTQDNMMSVIYEAGNAHSFGAPDFSLQWRAHVVLEFANVRTSISMVNDFVWFL